MTKEEIIKLDTEVVSAETFEKIFASDCIIGFQKVGPSGLKDNCDWYILTLIDGEEVNLYCKRI